MVEKPKIGTAPSRYGIVGRYILQPDIFPYIARVQAGPSGERQITDALSEYAGDHTLYAVRVEGREYDAGDKLGFIKATVSLALQQNELASQIRQYLKAIL